MRLQRGDLIPHFVVGRTDGTVFHYDTVWQHRNLLLIVMPPAPRQEHASRYVADIMRHNAALVEFEAECVITSDMIAGVEPPAVLIADRWGEIFLATHGRAIGDLPGANELIECLRRVAYECPECQGEAR